MQFGPLLRQVRTSASLSQAALSERTGVARPNVVAYETGRRVPRFDSAIELLDAVGAEVSIEPPVTWRWITYRHRPYAVPSRLWRLPPERALRPFTPGPDLWWSGPPRRYDLAVRADRCRVYELVLREGEPEDIASLVDGTLLCEAWPDLALPRAVADAWAPLVEPAFVHAPERGA